MGEPGNPNPAFFFPGIILCSAAEDRDMRHIVAPALGLLLAGCVTTDHERFRDYNDDGLLMFQYGRYTDARESFEAALRLKPDDPGLIYNIGQCYDRRGDAVRAERLYRECLKLAPSHALCQHALASLMMQQNRRDEVARMVEDTLTRSPSLAAPYALDGWYWRQLGDLPRAQARLQQALEIEPQNILALTEMAQVYEAMQRPDRALVLYERARQLDPKQTELGSRIDVLVAKGAGRPRPE
jgi:tetratricopeptide (TPR) repeat protein